jgi:hypothetical protein
MKANQFKLLYFLAIIGVVVIFLIKPIQQDSDYHHFADTNELFSISNFWNVISNIPFVIIGFIGIIQILKSLNKNPLKSNYLWFFIGILLTGFGSGYYHLNPNDNTLIWDRLPMTISFMSFLSIIIGEFIDVVSGKKLLYPLLLTGFLSIVYWVIFQDLRMYVLVQFLPIILIPIILFISKNNLNFKKYFWLILLTYSIAKFLESYDLFIYSTTFEMISGHTLKHFAAAAGPFLFYCFVKEKFLLKKK